MIAEGRGQRGSSPTALEGVRILDFTRLGFGAQATLICGRLGAEVIRVRSKVRPDPARVMPPYVPDPGAKGEGFGAATLASAKGAESYDRGGIFYKYDTGGRKSIAVDARHEKGLSLLKRLVASSDVVTESFSAGTLERWGLSYEVIPWEVVRAPDEVLDDPHLPARGHFVELEHPEISRTVTYPGAPFAAHASPWAMRRLPPLLGEHSDEVRSQWSVTAQASR